MNAGTARAAAREWVALHASGDPDFRGAYIIGSSADLPDEAELPRASDVDLVVVTSGPEKPVKPGKMSHAGALIDVTEIAWGRLSSPEKVLPSYHLAAGLRRDTIIADPTGELRTVQRSVSEGFADEAWVRRRCAAVRESIESGLDAIASSGAWHDQVTTWLFATGRMAHVVLVAGLRDPTVRLRYLAARQVLEDQGQRETHAELLALLGCADLPKGRVAQHVAMLAGAFDAAASVAKTPFSFSSDVSAIARPIAIDGSLDLVRAGDHREAVFWIVATFARCVKILAADAPADMQQAHAEAFSTVLRDLGIASVVDLLVRAESARALLPELFRVADAIIAANTEVKRTAPSRPPGASDAP